MPQSLAANYIHVIFSTKHRHPFLADPERRANCHAYIGGICRKLGSPALSIGGVEDHIHILINLHKGVALSDLLREIKQSSSQWMHVEMPDFGWQNGYAAYSISATHLPAVRRYFETQEEHHSKRSFQTELREIMAENGLEWDERYFWD
ncbi:MAG: transposase [Fimbriimonadaceae bacterium]|nr:transposase [Fimbriimonadaceae bacterium]